MNPNSIFNLQVFGYMNMHDQIIVDFYHLQELVMHSLSFCSSWISMLSLKFTLAVLSCAGAFVGCALNGNMVSTRVSENSRFYGAPVKAAEILLGSMPRPPAAATLYRALYDLIP